MKSVCFLLIAALVFSPTARAQIQAQAQTPELDRLFLESASEVDAVAQAEYEELLGLRREIAQLKLQIEDVKAKIRLSRKIRNVSLVMTATLAIAVGIALRKSHHQSIRSHPYFVRGMGVLIAATGVTGAGGAEHGHYLISIHSKELQTLEKNIERLDQLLFERMNSLQPDARGPK